MRAHLNMTNTKRATSARCVVVRSFAKALPLQINQRSSAIHSPWSMGYGNEDAPQPGEVSA